MAGPLEGQIALVTGASRGIGAATAEALAAAGAHVILTARTSDALEAVEDRIFQSGGTATIAPLDLTDGESIGRLANAVATRWQRLDIMVLNAATLGTLTPVQHLDPKELAKVLTLNVGAQAALIAAFDPMMRASGKARLIGLTSSVASRPRAFWGGYGASKAALENLLDAYAQENAASGSVRVAIVDPGATRTQMRAKAYPGEDPQSVKEPSIVANQIVALLSSDFATGLRQVVNQID